jgi:hypothetical protein
MARTGRKPTNHFTRWTPEEELELIELFNSGKTPKQVARSLKRTRHSVCLRKHQLMEEGRLEGRFAHSEFDRKQPETPEVEVLDDDILNEVPDSGIPPLVESLTLLVKRYGVSCTLRYSNMEITLSK